MKTTTEKCVCFILSLLLLFGAVLPATESYIQTQALSSTEVAANEKIVYDYCTQVLGYNTAASVAILANVDRECDFDPHCKGDNGNAYGILQWNYRRSNLINWCTQNGLDYTDINAQLGFFRHELTGSDTYASSGYYNFVHSYMLSVPNTAQGAYDAAYYFASKFEGCVSSDWSTRAVLARDTYWPKYSVIVDPTVTTPVHGEELNATAPGNLSWSAVPNAQSYRYTIRRVNENGTLLKTVASSVLVSSSVRSVSLLQSVNGNLLEALQSGCYYTVLIVAYSDTAGKTALGSGTQLSFSTSITRLVAPSLSSPTIVPTKYTDHYAGTYSGTVSASGSLNVVWTSTGNYYTYNVRILSGTPNPAYATESGTDLYAADQSRTANSLSLSASVLGQYAGKWIRLKIVAHSNNSSEQSSLPVYYYFQRDHEIAGYTVSFDATGGTLANYSQFIMKNETVTMPTATGTAVYLEYIPNGGRNVPTLQSFTPVNVGWTSTPYGTTVVYTTGVSYPFNSDVKLYAVWKSTVKLSTIEPIRSGYDFIGWSYKTADGAEVLKPGSSINLTGEISDIYVSAVWERDLSEPVLTSVRLVSIPECVIYQVGSVLDKRGLQVEATYSDGSTAIISDGLIFSVPSMQECGMYTVEIDCEGKTLSYDIYVVQDIEKPAVDAGDVTFDTTVNSADARYILRASVGLEKVNAIVERIGDVDNSGSLNSADARLVLRASVGLENVSSWPRFVLEF